MNRDTTLTGVRRVASAFAAARAQNRAALMPYMTLGFPSPGVSLDVLQAIAGAGADLIELGVPFSDPLADGPTIQRSTQLALEQGMSVGACLRMVGELRSRSVLQPLLLMGYINPILAYGVERFAAETASAGADGLILPDLPPEEAAEIQAACALHGLALVFLLSPSSPPQRVRLVAERTSGFLYLVSLTGVTGARQALPPGLPEFVARARAAAHTPLAVGFGISNPAQARLVGGLADGVIVGSALVDAVGKAADPAQAASDFVSGLRAALEKQPPAALPGV